MKKLLLRLAFANVIIALDGLGYALMACLLVGRTPSVVAVLPAFANIFAAYTFDKCARLDPQDSVNDPERTAFIRRWRWPLIGAASVGLVAGAVLAWRAGALGLALYLSPFLGAVLYTLPVIPTARGWRKIKEVTGLKSTWVALCWGVGTGWLPVVLVGGAAAFATAVVVAWTAARMFINTVYFDLGDVAGDRQEGVATIPVRFGFHATRRFLYALDLLSGAGLLGLAVVGRVPPSAYAMSLITLYSGYYLWRAVDEETDLGFLCDVVADAEAFVVGALATGLALGGVA